MFCRYFKTDVILWVLAAHSFCGCPFFSSMERSTASAAAYGEWDYTLAGGPLLT